MNKITCKSILYFIIAILVFSSCSNLPEQARIIPSDASMVGVIDIVSVGQKGKFQDANSMKMYKRALDLLQNSDENTAVLFETLIKDPSKTGIDIFNDLFMYSVFQNEKGFFCISLKVDDKEKFQGNLEELLSDDYDLIKGEEYTYYSNESKSWIAFNDECAVFISAIDANQETGAEFIDRLFTLQKSETILESKEFNEFYKNKKDISFWISSTQILLGLSSTYTEELKKSLEEFDGLSLSDIENNYVHLFVNFEDNNITFDFSLQANEAFKKYIESTSFSKDKINEELYSYFPQKNYFLAAYAFEPQKFYNYLKGINEFKSFENDVIEQGIQPQELVDAIGGDIMLSVFDVSIDEDKQNRTMLRLNQKGKYEYYDTVLVENRLIPKGNLVFSIKNESVIQKLLTNIFPPESYKKIELYYDFTQTTGFPLFVGVHNKMAMVTTDKNAIKKMYEGGYAENFTTSNLSKEIESSSFYYLNLDYQTYPTQLKEYVKKLGVESMIKPYTSVFESIIISTNEDYSGQLKITMKSDTENSLYQVLELLDTNLHTL